MTPTYDAIQMAAKLVVCASCRRPWYATHPTDPYVCVACRQRTCPNCGGDHQYRQCEIFTVDPVAAERREG